MKKIISYLAILVSCVLLSACNKEQTAIDNLQALVEDVEENGSEFSIEEWTDAAEEFASLTEEMHGYKYDKEDRKKIRDLRIRASKALGKHSTNTVKDVVNEAAAMFKGFTDGVNSSIEDNDDDTDD